MARVHPIDLPMIADIKLGTADLISAIKSLATADRLRRVASERRERATAFTRQQEQVRQDIVRRKYAGSPIRLERLAVELERSLDKDTIFVTECDSGKSMDQLMSFGGEDKTYLSTGPLALGWAVPAAFGAKLAKPDRPVVAILGDGAMLFGGMQPLWSLARYKAPVTVIVFNNRSYNNERNRIWLYNGGNQLKLGRDMTCYNGNPDVDFAKASIAFGVEAESVTDPDAIAGALMRAKRANIEGRPYLLDVVVQRDGVGWASTYHPEHSIAASRKRQV
jgi:thiamine pyrophosphate-dependent acetolactate synthase large subunit-like protein